MPGVLGRCNAVCDMIVPWFGFVSCFFCVMLRELSGFSSYSRCESESEPDLLAAIVQM